MIDEIIKGLDKKINEFDKRIKSRKAEKDISEIDYEGISILEERARGIEIAKLYLEAEFKNNGWVLCSERLPSDEECSTYWINHPCHRQFICTVKIGDYGPQTRQLYLSKIFGWKYGPEDYNKYVIAWQPLPQPYKGE